MSRKIMLVGAWLFFGAGAVIFVVYRDDFPLRSSGLLCGLMGAGLVVRARRS